MQKSVPRITVVTPSYNQAPFLKETIESVLNQDYPNLEYFIVDGGSNDGSQEIIHSYADQLQWWVSEPDRGQADALRKGFSRATGDVIGWLNSDDVYFPNALSKIGQAYKRNPDATIIAGGTAIGALGDGPIRKCVIPSSPTLWLPQYGMMRFNQQASFYNRQIYEAIGGINPDLYIRMDGDLWYRLMRQRPSATTIDDLIGFFRWHETSKSYNSNDRHLRERSEFIASLNISQYKFKLMHRYFQLRHLVTGAYIKSYTATRQIKGKTMQEIWVDSET